LFAVWQEANVFFKMKMTPCWVTLNAPNIFPNFFLSKIFPPKNGIA
jgi:hypothetical protein